MNARTTWWIALVLAGSALACRKEPSAVPESTELVRHELEARYAENETSGQ